MAPKTWFITGTSRGLGREWAVAALERGDNVAATARRIDRPRVLLGDGPVALATAAYESRLATWRQWEPLSTAAHGHVDHTG